MKKPIISFEDFEEAVMQKIMEVTTPTNLLLREQYKNASIISRTFSGVGFFTDFSIPLHVKRITEPVEYDYGDVEAVINGIEGFGFILFITEGVMSFLEGYTYQDSWPEIIYGYTLTHSFKHVSINQ